MQRVTIEQVKSLGDTVGCTITAHHLSLIVDDWAGKNHRFCKPVAKYPHDRAALRQVVTEGRWPGELTASGLTGAYRTSAVLFGIGLGPALARDERVRTCLRGRVHVVGTDPVRGLSL